MYECMSPHLSPVNNAEIKWRAFLIYNDLENRNSTRYFHTDSQCREKISNNEIIVKSKKKH